MGAGQQETTIASREVTATEGELSLLYFWPTLFLAYSICSRVPLAVGTVFKPPKNHHPKKLKLQSP